MTQAPAAIFKISQNPRNRPARPPARAEGEGRPPGSRRVLPNGTGRTAARSGGEVIELSFGAFLAYVRRGRFDL